jgi:hypothetical protein
MKSEREKGFFRKEWFLRNTWKSNLLTGNSFQDPTDLA